MAIQQAKLSSERWSKSWPVIAFHVQGAMLGAGMACLMLFSLFWWRIGGLVIPPVLPRPFRWILFPSGTLAFGWFAVEVGRTAAARLGYRWGRESTVFQFDPCGKQTVFLGIVLLFPISFALIPVPGLWTKVLLVGMAVFSASMGVTMLICAWTYRPPSQE